MGIHPFIGFGIISHHDHSKIPGRLDERLHHQGIGQGLEAGQAVEGLQGRPAAHPQAQRQQFLDTLRQRVRSGYLRGGFPDPKVAVSYNETAGRAGVDIVEGARFRCGAVAVTGVSRSLASAITDRLTKYQRRPPDFSLMSVPGKKPASDENTDGKKDNGVTFDAVLRATQPSTDSGGQPPCWSLGEPVDFLAAGPPPTPKRPVTDTIHGVKVVDNYRWLENIGVTGQGTLNGQAEEDFGKRWGASEDAFWAQKYG